jgi:hypothetical protein
MHVLCFVEVSSELTLQVKNDLENNILEKETCYWTSEIILNPNVFNVQL